MNVPPPAPTARTLMERALEPHILLGMPHLTPSGLSETWLMKELGHRHWLLLALHLGMDNADFRTDDGQEAYAAICATSLKSAGFAYVQANDILSISSAFSTVSRTQAATHHTLTIGGRIIGEVELITAFVYRQIDDDNYSIARVTLGSQCSLQFRPNPLAQTAAEIRSGRFRTYFDMPVDTGTPLRTFEITPSPSQEFNGAGLLYFANFQSIVDRALESWFCDDGIAPAFRQRDVFYSGNIRKGENLSVEMGFFDPDESKMICNIRRPDGQTIARIFMANTA